MTWETWVIGALAVAVVLLAGYVVVLRRSLARDGLSGRAAADDAPATAASGVPALREPAEVEYLITHLGEPDEPEQPTRPTVRDSVVLSATLGEPLVKAVALAHGLRRALSPANRNRIGFEVRQEVRRSRKVRRQEMRVAWREMKARERAQDPVPQPAPERA